MTTAFFFLFVLYMKLDFSIQHTEGFDKWFIAFNMASHWMKYPSHKNKIFFFLLLSSFFLTHSLTILYVLIKRVVLTSTQFPAWIPSSILIINCVWWKRNLIEELNIKNGIKNISKEFWKWGAHLSTFLSCYHALSYELII